MTATEVADASGSPGRRGLMRRILGALAALGKLLVLAWGALVLYYANLPAAWLRILLAVAFAAFGIHALFRSRSRATRGIFLVLFVGVVVWFVAIPARHDRAWRPEVAVLPHAVIDGDRVRFTGYRNFEYRTRDDFTERFEEREVRISEVTSVDLLISYWAIGPVAHTFVSFNFENGPPVCISIETRPEMGEGFAPIASMFKQFELIYVVGDERDLIRSRTNYREEDVFLYRIQSRPEAARELFRVYLDRINEIEATPEWYHLLKNNCGLNIVRYANAAGREGSFDLRHLLNGWLDRYLYEAKLLDPSLPFEELRRRSHINDVAQATPNTLTALEFSRTIRKGLPGMGER